MSSINSIILPFINNLLFTFFPGKEEKEKRINQLAEKIEKLLSNFTTNKSTMGYIILTIHWIGLLFVYWMALFVKTFIVYKIYYKMKFGEDIDTYNIISNKIKKMI